MKLPTWAAHVADWFGILWQRIRGIGEELGMTDYDFNWINPRLATGAAPVTQDFVDALAAAGVTHILDVTDGFDDTSLLATHPAVAYSYNPTADDGQHKSPDWFAKSLTFALPAFAVAHAKVYSHCSAGVNRGPSSAYAIMRALGFPPADAEATIRAARPQVGLAYKADADAAITALGYS